MQNKKLQGIRLLDASEYFSLDNAAKERYMKRVRSFIAKGDNALLKKMMAIVEKDVENYQVDFYVFDFYALANYSGSGIWMTRKNGTDIVLFQATDEDLKTSCDWFSAVKETNTAFYLFDTKDASLKKMSLQEAEKAVNKQLEARSLLTNV